MPRRNATIACILLAAAATVALAAPPETFLNYFTGKPDASTAETTDRLLILQGGAVKKVSPSTIHGDVTDARHRNLSTSVTGQLAGKQPLLANRTTVAKVGTGPDGKPTWDGSDWPDSGGDASTVTYSNPTYTTVEAALDALLYVAPGSPSVSNTVGTVETGSTVSTVDLNWTIALGSVALTSQSIDNSIGPLDTALRTYIYATPFTSDKTFTVTISDGTTTRTGSTSVLFRYQRYWGVSASTTLDDVEIRALSSEFSTSRVQTKSLSPSAQYLYFCWPDTWGAPAWTVNGLSNTDFELIRNNTFVNAAGASYTIRLYRSGNLLTGTYTVGVN